MKTFKWSLFKGLLSAILFLQPVLGGVHSQAVDLKKVTQDNSDDLLSILKESEIDIKERAKKLREMRKSYVEEHKTWQRSSLKAKKAQGVQEEPGCCACTVITPEDFGESFDETYAITVPGKYTLQQDVVFSPQADFQPAIIILSDDVTLDLCSHTLSQGNTNFLCNAVQIGSGFNNPDPTEVLKNIEVRNGNITHFTNVGIYAYNDTFTGPNPVALPFEDLRFSDLNILYGGSSPLFEFAYGINLEPSSFNDLYILDNPVDFKNITIERCNVNRGLGNSAISIITADGVVILDTQANDLLNDNGFGFATFAYRLTARNLEMSNCQGNRTRQEDFTTGQCGGLICQDSVNIYVRDSQFNDAFGEAASIVNTNPSNVINGVFENCQFNNARGGATARLVMGVHMSDRFGQETEASSMKFLNCQFNGSRQGSRFCSGFLAVTLKNILFEGCQARDIHAQSPETNVYGFRAVTFPGDPEFPFGMLNSITFRNCIVSDVKLQGSGEVYGYFLGCFHASKNGPNPSLLTNAVFDNCIAERIHAQGGESSVGIAVDTVTEPSIVKNVLVRGCTVFDVHLNFGGIPNDKSAGIRLSGVENPVILDNNVVDCDRGILFTTLIDLLPAMNAYPEGEEYYTVRGLVQDNRVTNCLISGYQDDRCPTASAWINNVAVLNGDTPSYKANYAIKWPCGKPQVDIGTLGKYPKNPNKNYNLSLNDRCG